MRITWFSVAIVTTLSLMVLASVALEEKASGREMTLREPMYGMELIDLKDLNDQNLMQSNMEQYDGMNWNNNMDSFENVMNDMKTKIYECFVLEVVESSVQKEKTARRKQTLITTKRTMEGVAIWVRKKLC